MTSTPQQTIPTQQANTAASQGAAQTQTSAVGTNSSGLGRSSYASTAKKSFTPNASESSNMSAAVGAPPVAHGRSDSVNGRNPTIPAIPAVGGPMIMNGQGDHNRKPSMTVTPAGVTGSATNGSAISGNQNKPNSIQFGSINAAGSPAMGTSPALANQSSANLSVASLNQRAASPQGSPSPIPQPAIATGGKLPTAFQAGNGLSFGRFGGEGSDPNGMMQPMSQMPLGPQQDHMRRGSTQSIHSDMGGAGMPTGPGRGQQFGRGRGGYPQQFQPQQYPHAPNPNFRPNQNNPRGGMNTNYGRQNQQHMPYQQSPNIGTRSPAMMNVNPGTPQMGQMQMAQPGGQGQHYGGYPHMGPQQVNSHSSIPRNTFLGGKPTKSQRGGGRGYRSERGDRGGRSNKGFGRGGPKDDFVPRNDPALDRYQPQVPFPQVPIPFPLPTDLSPESGHFESILTQLHQGFPIQPDPSIQYMYANTPGFMGNQHMQGQYPYMPPQSPRPPFSQGGHAPFMQQTYSNQGQPPPSMSRQSSQMSMPDRPTSSIGQTQTQAPAMASTSTASHATNRAPSVSVPKSSFQLPPKKSAAIVIKNAAGEVVNFSKSASSPVSQTPLSTTPSIPSAPTPPSRSASTNEAAHGRTDSASAKTAEDKSREMREAVAKKVAEAQAVKAKEQDEAEQKALKEKEDADIKAREAESAAAETEAEAEAEAETAAAAEAEAMEEEPSEPETPEPEPAQIEEPVEVKEEPAPEPQGSATPPVKPDDDEPDFDAIEAEFAAQEAEEARKEAEYQEKKRAKAEAQRKKEEEEEAAYEATLKEKEREAEERELAKEKKAADGSDDEATSKMFASLKLGDVATPASTESPDIQTPIESGAATPNSESSMPPPARSTGTAKRAKGPAELTLNTTKAVEPPEPSATLKSLKSARLLEDPTKIDYPSGIASPNPALNANAPADRKFKYNKEFLLQFQEVFKEKPSLDWDTKIREAIGDDQSATSARPSGSARTPSGMGARQMSNRPPAGGAPFSMGTFGAPARAGPTQLPPGTTSEQRFAMSNSNSGGMSAGRNAMPNPFAFGRPQGMPPSAQMSRNGSNNPLSGIPPSPRMGGPSRGGSRADSKRNKGNRQQEDNKMPLTAGMDVGAIQVSATGWKPRSVGGANLTGPALGGDGHMAPDVVQRKVKAALNKMTPEKFDRIADQILEIAAQSKDESDGRTLRQVIQLTFEKATDEAHWAPMYAMFCQRMLQSMSADIKDENIKDKNGNIVTGGNLFRKYLLNRCQEEFEKGWKVNLPQAADGQTQEAVILSDEYYIAAAAKRRGLGLVKFIGELFKLGMLTERIMHECVKKLLDYEGIPDEAEVESLTSLLRTVGSNLDKSESKAQPRMALYFDRITQIMNMPELPSRLRYMLLDILDLRKAGWHSKEDNKGPKTITEIHEEAEAAARKAEVARLQSQANRGGGRMPMGRGDARSFSTGYGQMPPPDNSNRVGTDDLRRLGNRIGRAPSSNASPGSFGPASLGAGRTNSRRGLGPGSLLARGDDSGNSSRTGTPPAGKKDDKKDESSTNAFSALAALEQHDGPSSPPSNPSSPPTQKSQPSVERERSRSPEKSKE